ncbi:50S ribosomal protein L35 [Patescibacteria group bacterium]|nr:50S ribosomal protein L35 [Patescibacteria group bacterium]
MKTRKSITKRFKITKNGKILGRAMGQDHCRAKKSGNKIRQMKKWIPLPNFLTKKIKRIIKH